MFESSFLFSMVDLKEAQKELHSMIPPLNVGTSMVGRSFLLMEPQQGLDAVVLEDEERLSDLSQVAVTSAPSVVRTGRQASNSALIGWSLGRLAVCHWLLREENKFSSA